MLKEFSSVDACLERIGSWSLTDEPSAFLLRRHNNGFTVELSLAVMMNHGPLNVPIVVCVCVCVRVYIIYISECV